MNKDILARGAGIGAIVLGCALAYWSVWEPLEMARTGAAEISYRMKSVFGVPVVMLGGLAYVIGGAKFDAFARNPENGRFTKWGLVIALACLGLGGPLYWWMTTQFGAMGYIEG